MPKQLYHKMLDRLTNPNPQPPHRLQTNRHMHHRFHHPEQPKPSRRLGGEEPIFVRVDVPFPETDQEGWGEGGGVEWREIED